MRYSLCVNLFTLLLTLMGCEGDTPDFELGRYEYAGIDNKTFRFFRVENGRVYREVAAPKVGIGEILDLPFCDEDRYGIWFYDCGLFPDLEKPYFEFRENEVEIAIFYAPDKEIQKGTSPYKIEGDSIVIGELPYVIKYPRPTGPLRTEFKFFWRIYQTTRPPNIYSIDVPIKSLTAKEHLDEIRASEQLIVGDTIALCLFREKYVKK